MTEREALIAKAMRSNAEDVAENGLRLACNRSTWIVARSGLGWVLRGGCGAGGGGHMWVREVMEEKIYEDGSRRAPDSEDPTYAEAPVGPSMRDDFGDYICECGERDNDIWSRLLSTHPPCGRSSSGE